MLSKETEHILIMDVAKGMTGALRASIALGIHDQNFKNGAFKASIPRAGADVVDALDVLIASDLLLHSEKEVVENCRNAWIQHREAWFGSTDKYEQLMNMMDATQYFEPLFEMFKRDADSRGPYVPDMTLQSMNEDGSVKETTTFDSNGMPITTEGGIMGVPTGAPEGFVENEKKFAASCGLSGDKSEGECQDSCYAAVKLTE